MGASKESYNTLSRDRAVWSPANLPSAGADWTNTCTAADLLTRIINTGWRHCTVHYRFYIDFIIPRSWIILELVPKHPPDGIIVHQHFFCISTAVMCIYFPTLSRISGCHLEHNVLSPWPFFTSHVSGQGNRIGSVCLSICLSDCLSVCLSDTQTDTRDQVC